VRPGLAAAPGDASRPYRDATLSAGLGLAPRTDGTQQLTFQGAPLYSYIGDIQPATSPVKPATVSGSS